MQAESNYSLFSSLDAIVEMRCSHSRIYMWMTTPSWGLSREMYSSHQIIKDIAETRLESVVRH